MPAPPPSVPPQISDDNRSSAEVAPSSVPQRILDRLSRLSALRIAVLVGFVVGMGAWWATGPRWVTFLNWDSGVYLWALAHDGAHWTGGGWSSHFAMTQLYIISTWIAAFFGGTPMQGFRLLGALAFGVTAALVALAARGARLSIRWTAAVVLLWLFCYPTVLDLTTVEDNAAFLPTAAALFWLVSDRMHRWRWSESLAAGAFAALSMLVSWQAVLYLAPALYVAAILARPTRGLAARCLHSILTCAAFFATLTAWIAFQAVTTKSTFAELWHSFFARPQPSLFPNDRAGILALLGDFHGLASTIGIAAYRIFLPGSLLPALTTLHLVGFVTIAVLCGVFLYSLWRWYKHGDRQTHFFVTVICFFTVTTGYYQIAEQDNIKRFDFVPLTAAFLVIAWMRTSGRASTIARTLTAALFVLLIAAEAAGAAHWWRVTMATPATPTSNWVFGQHPAPAVVAGSQQSWYRRFDDIKRSRPGACRYVFDISEMRAGRWWSEIPGLLWSEMRDTHRVLAEPAERRGWKRPAHFVTAAELVQEHALDCAWVSDAALARLRKAGISPAPK